MCAEVDSPKALPHAIAILWLNQFCNPVSQARWHSAVAGHTIAMAFQHLSSDVQVDKILGKGAPPEFIEEVRELCLRHHCDLEVDVIR